MVQIPVKRPSTSLNVMAANGNTAVIPLFYEKKFDGVEIVVSTTGRIWMDRNLGAQRAAMSFRDVLGFGGYFQWGRQNDGHAYDAASIPTTSTNSSLDTPDHGLFILEPDSPWDWLLSQNNSLWQQRKGDRVIFLAKAGGILHLRLPRKRVHPFVFSMQSRFNFH